MEVPHRINEFSVVDALLRQQNFSSRSQTCSSHLFDESYDGIMRARYTTNQKLITMHQPSVVAVFSLSPNLNKRNCHINPHIGRKVMMILARKISLPCEIMCDIKLVGCRCNVYEASNGMMCYQRNAFTALFHPIPSQRLNFSPFSHRLLVCGLWSRFNV